MTSLVTDARFFVDGISQYLRRGRTKSAMLPKVTAVLHKISQSAQTGRTAIVESAVVLTPGEKAQIQRFLSRLLTHTVTLECRINKELIGGLRVAVGDWTVDTSIATQIRRMQELLIS